MGKDERMLSRRSLLLGLGSLVIAGEPARKAYSFLTNNPLSLTERYQTFADEFFRMMEGADPITSGAHHELGPTDQYGKTYERWSDEERQTVDRNRTSCRLSVELQ